MSNKRKRNVASETSSLATEKPLSAIAAARLRSEAAAKSRAFSAAPSPPALTLTPTPRQEIEQPLRKQEPTLIDTNSAPVEYDSDTDGSIAPTRKVKLCNWNHSSENIQADTEDELTVVLKKHSTIALVGCFEFRVLKGAINISGANISINGRNGQRSRTYRVYVPVTHPILKIRGLGDINHVQLLNCPNPYAELSSSFTGIWNAPFVSRSFSIVSLPYARSIKQAPNLHLLSQIPDQLNIN
jgi:polynucleotide 5'-hydroxyl-kinase GRC3/NOL9